MITLKHYLIRSGLLVFPSGFLAGFFVSYFLLEATSLRKMIIIGFVAALISVVIVLIFAYLVGYKRFIYPANRIIEKIGQVSDKDLSTTMKTDNLGYLKPVGYNLNEMIEINQHQIMLLQQISNELDVMLHSNNEKFEQVNLKSHHIQTNLEKNESNMNTIRHALTQLSGSIHKLHHHSEEIKNETQKTLNETEKFEENIESNDLHMEQMKQLLIEIDDRFEYFSIKFEDFTGKVNYISNFLNQISDISKKTHLLSLNAQMEAARAGEHGKGFSMVAQEIKKLSEHTNQAVHEIYQITGEIELVSTYLTQEITEEREKTKKGKETFLKLNEETTDFFTYFKENIQRNKEVIAKMDSINQHVFSTKGEVETQADAISDFINQSAINYQYIFDIIKVIRHYEKDTAEFAHTITNLKSHTEQFKTEEKQKKHP